jgi:type VI secretion system protein VasG
MTYRDSTLPLRKLNDHCARALEAAANLCHARMQSEITLEHWLLKLLESEDGDIAVILRRYDIDADAIWNALLEHINGLPRNARGKPELSRVLADRLHDAWLCASAIESPQPIRSAHLLQALIEAPQSLRCTDCWPLLSISSNQIAWLRDYLEAHSSEASVDVDANTHATGENNHTSTPVHLPARSRAAPDPSGDALARYATDLSEKAREGHIDPVLGRDNEIEQMIDVLTRRRKNNPILLGEPGVGKTALVEGLALRVSAGTVPLALQHVRILALDLGLLQAGAGIKGEFEQRLKNVIDEVQRSPVPILLFIDEAHTLIGSGNAAGGSDAANLLKPALARGELRTIAATTWSEYKRYFERDAALERRFQPIKIEEPDDATACLMLRGLADRYASHHGVHIHDEALVAAVRLSRRYIPDRQLPDKAIDLVDTAAARVRNGLESPPGELRLAQADVAGMELELDRAIQDSLAGTGMSGQHKNVLQGRLAEARASAALLCERHERELALVHAFHACRDAQPGDDSLAVDVALEVSNAREALVQFQGKTPLIFADVDANAIMRMVAEWTGVPVGHLLQDDIAGLLSLEQDLGQRVVAQEEALAAVAQRLRIARAGLNNERAPLGVFLLVGPSGVGKTETALAIADLMFGGEAALTTINLSEYQEAHTVSQLKGSPPGYVGYGSGGVLTEAVRRRPYGIVLLDEVEKAHRDVLELFYQVFDRGTMRDGEGREIDFRHSVILMTSNLGSERIMDMTLDDPNVSGRELLDAIRPLLSQHFQPALLARCQPIVYRPLGLGALASIVRIKLDTMGARLERRYGIELVCEPDVLTSLAHACLIRESGARNVDSLLNENILPLISRELLARLANGQMPRQAHLAVAANGPFAVHFDGIAP